jgi:hypothetical protein
VHFYLISRGDPHGKKPWIGKGGVSDCVPKEIEALTPAGVGSLLYTARPRHDTRLWAYS